MKTNQARTVTLDIASRVELIDLVQTVLSHLCGLLGFDEEATHYMSVAVRESVVNAVRHGNKMEDSKRVAVAFSVQRDSLGVEVRDEGAGFDPSTVEDPRAEANLLKAAGRGIFFMRSFMDAVSFEFPTKGGTIVRMVKRLPS